MNSAPTAIQLTDVISVISEGLLSADIKVANIYVTDDGVGTNTLALSGTDADMFLIAGSELYLRAGIVVDHDVKSTYAVVVTASDDTADVTSGPVSTNLALSVKSENVAPNFHQSAELTFTVDGIDTTPSFNPDSSAWQLTPDIQETAGAIWRPIDLTENWTLVAQVNFGSKIETGGDGIAFVLQSQGASALADLGAADTGYHTGGTLGIGGIWGMEGLRNAFGIWLDDWYNAGNIVETNDGNSVSFFENNLNGSSLLPSGAMPLAVTPLDGGAWHELAITWDASTQSLSYRLLINPLGQEITGSQTFDPSSLPPGQVYFGFSAGTGDASNVQSVRVLSLVSDLASDQSADISIQTSEDRSVSGAAIALDQDDDNLTYGIGGEGAEGGPSHGRATINPKTGLFSYTPNKDYNGTDSFIVNVTDHHGGTDSVRVAVQVDPVDDLPTEIRLTNTLSFIAENVSTKEHIKVADIEVSDADAGDYVLAVTGKDAAYFEIFEGSLYIKSGVDIDFESQIRYDVSVALVDDGSEPNSALVDVDYTLKVRNISPEKLVGSAGSDYIQGGRDADTIFGFAGNDTLKGGAGDDVLVGGLGRDILSGNSGKDIFVFNSVTDTGKNARTRDMITDFGRGDTIKLSDIDASNLESGNQAFRFFGNQAFHGSAGELHVKFSGGQTLVEGDINGDRKADFQIEIAGHVNFVRGDFIL